MQWLALHDPYRGEDGIGEEQEGDGPLQCSPKSFDAGYPHEEKADGDFGPHEGSESLDPFAIGVFPKLLDLVRSEELFMAAKAIVCLDKVESSANSIAELDDIKANQHYSPAQTTRVKNQEGPVPRPG